MRIIKKRDVDLLTIKFECGIIAAGSVAKYIKKQKGNNV
jgi:hypothetical protein